MKEKIPKIGFIINYRLDGWLGVTNYYNNLFKTIYKNHKCSDDITEHNIISFFCKAIKFYNKYNFRCKIIRQTKPALWEARNRGIKSAKSEYLLFLDDDSRIAPDWILEHLKCLDYFQADISSGVSKSLIGAKIPENYSFFRWSDQLDTGNVLIKRNVFNVCGLFDRQFEKMRMGDGEFGVRAYINGVNGLQQYQFLNL